MNLAGVAAQGGRKRIFLGLLAASCIAVCLLLLVFFILPWIGPGVPWLGHISVAAGIGGICLLGWLCVTLVFHIYTGKNLPGITGMRHLCIRLFLPLMEMAGIVAGLDKTAVRRSFLKVNNEFVMAQTLNTQPQKLLVLLPHCMQASNCMIRMGTDLSRCAGCGKCQIAMIRSLADKYGFRAALATGGTIARRIVAENRPVRIVAIACERDLTAGIQDSYPIPVFGIINERPQGPCRDTVVPMQTLLAAIAFFLGLPSSELAMFACANIRLTSEKYKNSCH